jgi:uncharacterized protein (DUF302 family)
MNFAYFRNSNYSAYDTIEKLKARAVERGFTVIGESALPGGERRRW